MKKNIATLRTLLIAGFLFGLSLAGKAQTTAAMGSDLTYINIAPNVYQVQFKLYRDCYGAAPGSDQILNYRAAGCDTTSRTIIMNRIGTPVTGDPYCNNPAPCLGDGIGLINYQEHTYQGIVTLPAQCSEWLLSVRVANRPNSRNLADGQASFLFTEVLINNVATQTNSSPNFAIIPIAFVCADQQITFSQATIDIDGDSIVYTLVPALNDLNQPVVYGEYKGTGTGTNPYDSGPLDPATGLPSWPPGNFSATNPIIARNPLALDPITGMMVFKPIDYKGAPYTSEQGLNKYTVAVRVDEYRKISGVLTKIGHVRREIMMIVVDCTPVCTPLLTSSAQPVTTPFVFRENVNTCYQFTLSVCDSTFSNRTFGDTTGRGPRYTISGAGTNRTLTLCWRPTTADIRSQPYQINVILDTINCPLPGYSTHTLEIMAVKNKITNPGPVEITDPSQPGVSRQALPNQPIPNIITPNGDGLNDAFVIPNLPAEAELQIFDRKHKLIRTFKHYQNDWQGEGVKDGVYYYILKDRVTGKVTRGEITIVK